MLKYEDFCRPGGQIKIFRLSVEISLVWLSKGKRFLRQFHSLSYIRHVSVEIDESWYREMWLRQCFSSLLDRSELALNVFCVSPGFGWPYWSVVWRIWHLSTLLVLLCLQNINALTILQNMYEVIAPAVEKMVLKLQHLLINVPRLIEELLFSLSELAGSFERNQETNPL